jgi:hypothetical protein
MPSHRAAGPSHARRTRGPRNPERSKFQKGLYAVLIFLAFIATIVVIGASLAPIPPK